MQTKNYKTSLIGFAAGLLILAGVIYGYGFPYLAGKLSTKLDQLAEKKRTVLELRQEQKNIEQSKRDLSVLATKPISPDEFFSRDVTLVREITELEQAAQRFSMTETLGVSGTIASAAKIQNFPNIVSTPFSLKLVGSFSSLVEYMDWMEHAGSLLPVRSLSITAGDKNAVTANLVGVFYLKK